MNISTAFILELSKMLMYVLFALILSFTIIGLIAFCRTSKGTAKTFSLLIERGNILHMEIQLLHKE